RVADASLPVEVALHRGDVLRVLRRLANGFRLLTHLQPRTKRRVDALAEVEVQVPGLEVLEEMRDVHARPFVEVGARPEVDEAERLEIHDPARAETVLLGGRESEEELCRVGNQIRPGDAGREGDLLREAPPPAEPASDESLANACDVEDPQVA